MSTNSPHLNISSSFRPRSSRRPTQLTQTYVDNLAGGVDPAEIGAMSHATAVSLLSKVRRVHINHPEVVERVLHLVDNEGIDLIAELWAQEGSETLPGILWRLYTLREWMRKRSEEIAMYWRLGEPVEGAASAISGIDAYPDPQSIASTADSILRGAFTGDFAVALERAGTFCAIVAEGMKHDAPRREQLRRNASNLAQTSAEFLKAAALWRENALE